MCLAQTGVCVRITGLDVPVRPGRVLALFFLIAPNRPSRTGNRHGHLLQILLTRTPVRPLRPGRRPGLDRASAELPCLVHESP